MTQSATEPKSLWRPALLVFVMAMGVYAMGGNLGRLFHDDAIFFYGGREMLRGTPVYVGIFDHKGPLGQMVCALGIWIAGWLGKDDLLVTRGLFLLIASATAMGMFVFAARLFRSRLVGFLTSAYFVSFWGYGALAFSGTRPKMVMALFEVLALALLAERRWLLAGACIALGAFAWQPLGIYIVVALALAWLHSNDPDVRRSACLRTVAGGALPSLAVAGYFLASGAFAVFLDGCFLFNLRFLENAGTLRDQLGSLLNTLVYNGMGVVTLFGLLGVPLLALWRLHRTGSLRALARDRFAGLLLTFPFPVLWSLHDFQQYPDFFIFLPYVAIALGWMTSLGALAMAKALGLVGGRARAWSALPGVVLVLFSALALRYHRNEGLRTQWAAAREFEREYGDARTAIIGHPEALVLLGRSNPTPYGFIMRGIAGYIEATEPDGFEGWLRSVSATQPEVLIVDERYAELLGEHGAAWSAWLAQYERRPERIGAWSVYLPR